MKLEWTKKTPQSFDLVRSDGIVLARCINDRGIVIGWVYNALPSYKMRPIARELFDFMAPAMDWCAEQLTVPCSMA